MVIFMMFTTIALARPGGGSSGGTGGSGGASGASGGGSGGRATQANPVASAVVMVAFSTSMVLMQRTNLILSMYRVIKKEKVCKKTLEELSINNQNYSYEKINKDVSDTFYIMAKAWTNMNQDIAIEYSTDNLYKNHSTKLQWMKVRNERNILKNEKLLSMRVFGIHRTYTRDSIWIAIKGSMIDYIERDSQIIEGNKFIPTRYTEYWKFDNVDGKWLLDEIMQVGDINELEEIGQINIRI